MKYASILTVIVATLLVSSTYPQDGAPPAASKDQIDESAKKVKELRKERVAVLTNMRDQFNALFMNARVEYDRVLEAEGLLAGAKLDVAETDKERVELYKNLVAVLQRQETLLDGRRQAGREFDANVLKARAKRLEAEIHWEQAKMKVVNAGK